MNLKRTWWGAAALGVMALTAGPGSAVAQDDDSGAPTEEEMAAAEAAPDANPFGDAFGDDIDFKRIVAYNITYQASGSVTLEGAVVLESDQMDLECDRLVAETERDRIRATGSPVKIRQGDVRAQCGRLSMNTKTQVSTLTDSPVIYQKQGGRTYKTTGDVITITQDEEGRVSVTVKTDKRSHRPSQIELVEPPKAKTDGKEDDAPKEKPSRKIDLENLDMIDEPS